MPLDKQKQKARRERNRAIATEFVNAVNDATRCNRCGRQPIEWHREEHEEKPNSRVSSLRAQGVSLARILQEMDRCEPLCRQCHMAVDGRGLKLHQAAPRQKGMILVPPRPCVVCGKMAKPIRRDRCYTCYNVLMGIRQRKNK